MLALRETCIETGSHFSTPSALNGGLWYSFLLIFSRWGSQFLLSRGSCKKLRAGPPAPAAPRVSHHPVPTGHLGTHHPFSALLYLKPSRALVVFQQPNGAQQIPALAGAVSSPELPILEVVFTGSWAFQYQRRWLLLLPIALPKSIASYCPRAGFVCINRKLPQNSL